jgi:hypothetical protein
MMNSDLRSDNKSGVRGVFFHKQSRKWRVQIQQKYFGSFSSAEEAAPVAEAARRAYHGEFAR